MLSVLLAAGVSAARPKLRHVAFEGCRVTFHTGDAVLASQVGRSVSSLLIGLNRRLGVSFRDPVHVRLIGGEADFRQHLGPRTPEWLLAVALLERNEVLVRADLIDTNPGNALVPTLRHELCHLALHVAERAARGSLPTWFHEGVACHVSGLSLFTDWTPFDIAAAQNTLIPFARLGHGFPADRDAARLAYLQSEAFVRFVTRERSEDVIRWVLDAYAREGDFEAAVEQAAGESLASFETRWRERFRSRAPSWLRLAWRATTLFAVLALATIAAYWVRRRRARRVRTAWDQEDWRLGQYLQEAERAYEDDADEEEPEPWA